MKQTVHVKTHICSIILQHYLESKGMQAAVYHVMYAVVYL
jgi:hypothetical protein